MKFKTNSVLAGLGAAGVLLLPALALAQAARVPALNAPVDETQKTRSEHCGLKINAASELISCGRGSFHPRC